MAVLSVILVLDGRDWNLPYEARPSALGAPDAIWTGGRVAPDSKNALSPASTDRQRQERRRLLRGASVPKIRGELCSISNC
jgi:hypothetical protein